MRKQFQDGIYPQEFYDYADGGNIESEIVNEWLLEGYDYLRDNKDEREFTRAWGNTILIMTRYGGGINIIVAHDYKEYNMEDIYE